MEILSALEKKAKTLNKKIIFPEDEDKRIIEAVCIIAKKNIAVPVLIGKRSEISKKIASALSRLKMPPSLLGKIRIIDFSEIDYSRYANGLYEIRKEKGLTLPEARKLLEDKMYLATMMLKLGEADGVISGASHPTPHTLRPAFQIIKTKQGISLASGCFIITHEMGTFIFADCGVNENPNASELSEIAMSAAELAKIIGISPRIAMLSFSTAGSAKGESVEKVRTAAELVRKKMPSLAVEGEIQLDAAIVPGVSNLKFPDSRVPGNANILIFPNLDAGNIGYKLAQRFGNAEAIGPVIIGLNKPVNDLSRGCSVQDIVGIAIITAVQAGKK
jgi:phosphate acetyltransferase